MKNLNKYEQELSGFDRRWIVEKIQDIEEDYSLKFVLNPVENDIDINNWRKTEYDLFPITQELHQLLKENSEDEKQYHRYVVSVKSSVLTAFYKPSQVINAVSAILRENGLIIDKFLDLLLVLALL